VSPPSGLSAALARASLKESRRVEDRFWGAGAGRRQPPTWPPEGMARMRPASATAPSPQAQWSSNVRPNSAGARPNSVPAPTVERRRGATIVGPRTTNVGTQLGDAEAMEATKRQRWNRQVEKGRFGAHYDYIVMHVGAAHRKLKEDPVQKESDMSMARGLGMSSGSQSARGPREMPQSKSMHTAFTDRAMRIKEGSGAKLVVGRQDVVDWFDDRSTAAGTPRNLAELGAAGMTSHKHHGQGTNGRLSRDQMTVSKNFNSERVSSALMSAATTLENLPHEDFQQSLGRKVKAPAEGKMMPHRGGDPSTSAGCVTPEHTQLEGRDRAKKRQSFQGTSSVRCRSGVALVLEPRGGDPPPPNRITHSSKGLGSCNNHISEEASKHLRQNNPTIFRFAHNDSSKRSKSVPPDFTGCAGGTSNLRRGMTPVDRMQVTPRHRTKPGISAGSKSMSSLLNTHAAQDQDRQVNSARKRTEPHFGQMCAHTSKQYEEMSRRTGTIKSSIGRGNSSAVASQLIWN
jgi:hypothetical protein